ncbi:MAG: metallophosphoesterase [Ignavibacteria bacterium]|nr:metallophosphoesterase [Ignavibacteria bacterium]
MIITDTIIISDIHLGSDVSRAKELKELLKNFRFKRLILLGDIFDDLNFRRLKRSHWKFLSYIRNLSNPKNNISVIWVEGNHDTGLSKITSHFLGIKVYKEYRWNIAGKKFLAIHGHQFDRFLNENVIISNIASFIYNTIQKFGSDKQTLARWIKGKSKGWLRLSKTIAHSAVIYGKRKNVDVVICAHTHQAMHINFPQTGISYYNTGCWTDIPSSLIKIDSYGKVEIVSEYDIMLQESKELFQKNAV